jgi:hypothetical protein
VQGTTSATPLIGEIFVTIQLSGFSTIWGHVREQQQRQRGPKVYALHAPEVECIGKGKAHRPYEFGVKVSVATTLKHCKGGQFVTHKSRSAARDIFKASLERLARDQMQPRERRETGEQDLFRSRLDQIIDLKHPLVALGRTVDWGVLEREFGAVYADDPGRPPLPTRLMAGLAIFRHTYDYPTRCCASAGSRTPYDQFFCGEEFFQYPC